MLNGLLSRLLTSGVVFKPRGLLNCGVLVLRLLLNNYELELHGDMGPNVELALVEAPHTLGRSVPLLTMLLLALMKRLF